MKIANGFVYQDETYFADADLSFKDGVITEIGPRLAADETYDATGCYVVPGFIDIHIHGFGGVDAMNGVDAVKTMSRELVKHGTTSFMPTTMTAAKAETRAAIHGIAQAIADPEPLGATVLGCHMEGPFFCEKRKGAQPAHALLNPSPIDFEDMTGADVSAVRRLALAPELPGALELIKTLVGHGVQVSLGHTDATHAQMIAGVAAGASSVTHISNGMSPLTHREPGAVGAALTSRQLTPEFIADLIHLHPAALRLVFDAKGPENCIAITDSMEAGGMPDGQYQLGGQDVLVKDGAARLADGTLAGSVLTMRLSLRNMVTVVGVPIAEALPMYTSTPARLIGETQRGRLAEGMIADVVVLDRAFNIRAVWVSGKRCV
ncbi:MAG: N-acetylglucosamine-6-phosphate deacetylase [Oscillospiraceae bacterium]|jgi:N-acetylglucosamine-6-phosphate deacetylase|nr:N-acetylglucosamine-6-phosphate deacetylase [Oscillospiraceae bacterium]